MVSTRLINFIYFLDPDSDYQDSGTIFTPEDDDGPTGATLQPSLETTTTETPESTAFGTTTTSTIGIDGNAAAATATDVASATLE